MVGRAAPDVAVHRTVDVGVARRGIAQQAGAVALADVLPGLAGAALGHVEFAPGGAHRLDRLPASPSIVTIFMVAASATLIWHERIGAPSAYTVQAPQSPWPHPYFVPGNLSSSRRAHSNGVSGSTSTRIAFAIDREIVGHPRSSSKSWRSLESRLRARLICRMWTQGVAEALVDNLGDALFGRDPFPAEMERAILVWIQR